MGRSGFVICKNAVHELVLSLQYGSSASSLPLKGADMSDITLSLVVYNDYETPRNMIGSLACCFPTNTNLKLIIIDNSLDEFHQRNSSEFLKFLSQKNYIDYIKPEKNLGFGKGHNLALSKCSSEYFLIINPDIVFIEDSLTILKNCMDEHADIGMCIPKIVDQNGSLQQVYRKQVTVLDAFNRAVLKDSLKRRSREHTLCDKDYSQPFELDFGQGSFLFCRTNILRSVGGFDDRFFMYLEDADLCKKICQVSKFEYRPETTVIHLWEKGSHKDLALLKHHFSSYWKYFNKWGWKFM